MSVTLEQLVHAARATATRDRERISERELQRRIEAAGLCGRPPGRFRRALLRPDVAIIAEVKGASPVDGSLRPGLEPAALARTYETAGAAAVSVLTEERFFAGALGHLQGVARAVALPALRKDFIVEPYQILQAALAGAAAILLIAEAVTAERLAELVEVAHGVGLDALVEVHDPASVAGAAGAGSGLMGVNNRDLVTMRVDPEHALRIAADLPDDYTRVAESGIRERAQVAAAAAAGYDAVLVGSSLVTAGDPGAALRRLTGVPASQRRAGR